ncbi:MAG: hypothetical protein WCA35_22945 [Kovacikia sp.]
MWLYSATLRTGSLLLLVISDLWRAIAQSVGHSHTTSCTTSTAQVSKNCGRLYHRGSGRRELLQPVHSILV